VEIDRGRVHGLRDRSWGYGMWQGEEAITSEHWQVQDPDRLAPKHQHLQQLVRAVNGEEQRHGVLEQMILGDFPAYGLKGFLDPI